MRNFALLLVVTMASMTLIAADAPHGGQSTIPPQGHVVQPGPAVHALPGPVTPEQPHLAPAGPPHVEPHFRPELSRESTREVPHKSSSEVIRESSREFSHSAIRPGDIGRARMRWDGARWWNLSLGNAWSYYDGAAWVAYQPGVVEFAPPLLVQEDAVEQPAVVEQAPAIVQPLVVPQGYQYYDSHWWYQSNGAWVVHNGSAWVAPRAFYSGRSYFYERPGVRISIGR